MPDENSATEPAGPEPDQRRLALVRTRRGFAEALLVAIGTALVVVVFWIYSRDAPSAGRDPGLSPPVYAPTRAAPTPTPAASPATVGFAD